MDKGNLSKLGLLVITLALLFSACTTPPPEASGDEKAKPKTKGPHTFYSAMGVVKNRCIENQFSSIERLAIYGVISEDPQLSELIKQIDYELTAVFTTDKTRSFRIMERSALEDALKETQFNINQAVRSPNEIADIGEFVPADAILVGNITALPSYYRLRMRILSTESGELISSGVVNFSLTKDQKVAFLSDSEPVTEEDSSSAEDLDENNDTEQLVPETDTVIPDTKEEPESQEETFSNPLVLVEAKPFWNRRGDRIYKLKADFYISRYEITQEEYADVMGENPSESYYREDHLPVESVSWIDAMEYCNKRSEKEGLEKVYTFSEYDVVCDFTKNGYRLPTEHEWVYAARGGKNGISAEEAREDLENSGWLRDKEKYNYHQYDSDRFLYPVGQEGPNEIGLYDMTGNAHEWCWNSEETYSQGLIDITDEEQSTRELRLHPKPTEYTYETRIVRRGIWSQIRNGALTVDDRSTDYRASATDRFLSFRVARTATTD